MDLLSLQQSPAMHCAVCCQSRNVQLVSVQVESREPWSEAQQAAVEVIGQVLSEEAAATQASGDLGTSLSGSEPQFGTGFRGRGRGRGPPGRGRFGPALNGQQYNNDASWHNQQARESDHYRQDSQHRPAGRGVGNGQYQYQQPMPRGQQSDLRQRTHRGRGQQGHPPGLGRGVGQEGQQRYRGRGRGLRT